MFESPGYTVPEESAFAWIPGFVPVPEAVVVEEGGQMLSPEQPPPHPVPASAATPVVYWLEHMGRDRAVAAALRLHHDASLIMTNVQVMSQFVTSLNRTASEVMRMVYAREPFPTDAVHFVTPGRRVRCAAHYMPAMGLWRPTSSPVFPGPISVSSCNSCMTCEL